MNAIHLTVQTCCFVGAIVCLQTVWLAGCASTKEEMSPITDTLPPNAPKAWVEFYDDGGGLLVVSGRKGYGTYEGMTLYEIQNGYERRIGYLEAQDVPRCLRMEQKLASFGKCLKEDKKSLYYEMRRIAVTPGERVFAAKCGTGKQELTVQACEGMVTPVRVVIRTGELETKRGTGMVSQTQHFTMVMLPETPVAMDTWQSERMPEIAAEYEITRQKEFEAWGNRIIERMKREGRQ